MEQCYVSESLAGLDFKGKYRMRDYYDSLRRLFLFGMYRDREMYLYKKHHSEVVVIWTGSDAKKLTPYWAEWIKDRKAKHYAVSHWVQDTLTSHGIKSEIKPISATKPNLKPTKKGTAIYFYSSNESAESAEVYGESMIEEIKERTGLKVIRTHMGMYPQKELSTIYEQCFINLRLTLYDGCPNTNLEMGQMGIPSIFNGDIPGSIPWTNVEDICDRIIDEYAVRLQPTDLHNKIYQFLNQQFP